MTHNQGVAGSSPAGTTDKSSIEIWGFSFLKSMKIWLRQAGREACADAFFAAILKHEKLPRKSDR